MCFCLCSGTSRECAEACLDSTEESDASTILDENNFRLFNVSDSFRSPQLLQSRVMVSLPKRALLS